MGLQAAELYHPCKQTKVPMASPKNLYFRQHVYNVQKDLLHSPDSPPHTSTYSGTKDDCNPHSKYPLTGISHRRGCNIWL
jgi:hypothetical protein